jgi:hypothetical protein
VKQIAALAGVAGLGCMFFGLPATRAPLEIVVLGNQRGYLSPCGCSEPMSGGILREAFLIRRLQSQGPTLVVDTGDMTASDTRQEVMKAQTLAQTLKSLKVAAINLTPQDQRLGPAELENLQLLSGGALTSGTLNTSDELSVEKYKIASGYLIVGVSAGLGNDSESLNSALSEGLKSADALGLKTIVMLEGSQGLAEKIAQDYPKIELITYPSTSQPARTPVRVGHTLIVSPGEHGEYLLTLSSDGDGLDDYRSYKLTPEYGEDPEASRFYSAYLKRVDEDPHLWSSFPRGPGKPYAGAVACGKCHHEDYTVWNTHVWQSEGGPISHARALLTLKDKGHGKDPECLPCHVTGAKFETGYHSVFQNPQLAFVGCESCHGPGEDHAIDPSRNQMAKPSPLKWQAICESCHTPLNSPNFDYKLYWSRIRHGNVDKAWKSKK